MSGAYSTRMTTTVLSLGALASAISFVLAIALELIAAPIAAPIGPQQAATVGIIIVIATPAVSLVATALEYRGHKEAIVAMAVLGVLSLSLIIALTR